MSNNAENSGLTIILITLIEKPNFNQKFEFSRSSIWAELWAQGGNREDRGHDGDDGRGGGAHGPQIGGISAPMAVPVCILSTWLVTRENCHCKRVVTLSDTF